MLDKKNDIDVMWDEHPHFGKYSPVKGTESDPLGKSSKEPGRGSQGELDPYGKSPKESGSKLDAGKSPIYRGMLTYFPRACLAVANVSDAGARKYAWKGWETVPDGFNRYSDALGRHLAAESIEGMYDSTMDVTTLHAAQVAWNSLARLELLLKGME